MVALMHDVPRDGVVVEGLVDLAGGTFRPASGIQASEP